MPDLFAFQTPIWEIIFRAAVIYFFLLAALRLIGRHELGQLSVFDLVLLLIISESISSSITAQDKSLIAGLLSVSTLLVVNVLMSYGKYKSRSFRKLVSGESLKLIQDGKLIEKTMSREMMTRDDVTESLRIKGIERIEDVKLGYLEADGSISAITYTDHKDSRRQAAAEAKKSRKF